MVGFSVLLILDRISSEEIPTAGISNCCANILATVVQALIPVKLPGPILVPIASISCGVKLFAFKSSFNC